MNSFNGIVVSAIAIILLCTLVQCQLTFSPHWGKRSSDDIMGLFESQKGNCKDANEILTNIFRFLEMKAQIFAECTHGH